MRHTKYLSEIERIHEEIEDKFLGCCVAGRVVVDKYLSQPGTDQRRGLSVIFRPCAAIIDQVRRIQETLVGYTGDQYAYPASDLHVTVMSVIPASPDFGVFGSHIPIYVDAVERAIHRFRAEISLEFRGVLASDDSLLIKGFPHDTALRALRDEIERQLWSTGVGGELHRRYKIKTAHMTFLRYTSQVFDLKGLQAALLAQRDMTVGSSTPRSLELVEHDWYMRSANARLLSQFDFGRAFSR